MIPAFVLAQTSIDSTVTRTDSDGTVYTTNTDTTSDSLDKDPSYTDSTTDTTIKTEPTSEPVFEPSSATEPYEEPKTTVEPTTTTVNMDKTTDYQTPEDYTYDNIKTVTDSYNDINEEQKIVESELRDQIKDEIDDSIIEIRSQEDIEAYKLQDAVNDIRTEIYDDINATFKNTSPTDIESIRDLEHRINDALVDIEYSLENKSGVDVDLSTISIRETFLRYEKIIEEKIVILQAREGDLVEKDTDGDGLSDYDEKYIYKTDPENAYTVEGELNDAQKIQAGINPIDPEGKLIEYQDPREDRKSVISKVHKLERVELVTKEGEEGKRLQLSGTALPNSYVTVYIFSTPTIVTVKTNARGEWSYTLDKELDNGQHDVYVATVDNSGRLIARSESIPITKSDEAATLGTFGIGEPSPAPNNFVQENFILIILSILLFAVIVVLILSGGKNKEADFVVPEDESGNDPSLSSPETLTSPETSATPEIPTKPETPEVGEEK